MKKSPLIRKSEIAPSSAKGRKTARAIKKTKDTFEPFCARCGRVAELDPHHIWTRKEKPHMVDNPLNLIGICREPCHNAATRDPKEFRAWLASVDPERASALQHEADFGGKVNALRRLSA